MRHNVQALTYSFDKKLLHIPSTFYYFKDMAPLNYFLKQEDGTLNFGAWDMKMLKKHHR